MKKIIDFIFSYEFVFSLFVVLVVYYFISDFKLPGKVAEEHYNEMFKEQKQ